MCTQRYYYYFLIKLHLNFFIYILLFYQPQWMICFIRLPCQVHLIFWPFFGQEYHMLWKLHNFHTMGLSATTDQTIQQVSFRPLVIVTPFDRHALETRTLQGLTLRSPIADCPSGPISLQKNSKYYPLISHNRIHKLRQWPLDFRL